MKTIILKVVLISVTAINIISFKYNFNTIRKTVQLDERISKVFIDTDELLDTLTTLKKELPCKNKEHKFEILQHGDFWLYKNFIRAEHGEINCYETITYATHADFTYMANLTPLVERWKAPVSVGIDAPGSDFKATVDSIFYVRNCIPSKKIIRQFVTFHLFFNKSHLPPNLYQYSESLEKIYQCPDIAPYANKTSADTFNKQFETYQINLARNLAIKSALTYFYLNSDIELYPSLNVVPQFLELIAKNISLIKSERNVFFLPIFEVDSDQQIPDNKTVLKNMYTNQKANIFHYNICRRCHQFPEWSRWMTDVNDDQMEIYIRLKRQKQYNHYEPFFISTQDDPVIFDERLSWEGRFDKMTMEYILCVLDYNFLGLSNAFLVHSPGFKSLKESLKYKGKPALDLVSNHILPEITSMFGEREGCKMFV